MAKANRQAFAILDARPVKCQYCGRVCENGKAYAYHISHNPPDPLACVRVAFALSSWVPRGTRNGYEDLPVDEEGNKLCRCGGKIAYRDKCRDCGAAEGRKRRRQKAMDRGLA